MTTHEQEELWRAAKALATDKATAAVLDRLDEKFTQDWKESEISDSQTRDGAYYMVRAVAAFRRELDSLASEPDIARFNNRLKRS